MEKNKDFDKIIGAKIRLLREANKVTRLELAKILGYKTDTAVYLIEMGDRSISPEKLKGVATFFKTSVDEIMGDSEPVTIRTALRSHKKLTEGDMDQIEKYVEFLKNLR